MTRNDSAQEYSKAVKAEADKLLEETKLHELLSKYGDVDLGGSYKYDLMIDKDLDYGVAVPEMTPEIRSDIAALFAVQPWAYSVNMTDRINFEPLSNLQAPRGLFLGLTIPFPIERWNVDVWFIKADKLTPTKIDSFIGEATPEQKNTILEIKYELHKQKKSIKGVSSAEIYRAVIKNGITTPEEYLRISK